MDNERTMDDLPSDPRTKKMPVQVLAWMIRIVWIETRLEKRRTPITARVWFGVYRYSSHCEEAILKWNCDVLKSRIRYTQFYVYHETKCLRKHHSYRNNCPGSHNLWYLVDKVISSGPHIKFAIRIILVSSSVEEGGSTAQLSLRNRGLHSLIPKIYFSRLQHKICFTITHLLRV